MDQNANLNGKNRIKINKIINQKNKISKMWNLKNIGALRRESARKVKYK